MKAKLIGLLLAVPLLLVGCDEEFSLESGNMNLISVDSESPINLSLYPDSVANGTISVNMFEESMRYIKGITPRLTKITDFQNQLNANSGLQLDSEFKAEFIAAIEDYHVFAKGIYASPVTEADLEIYNSFSEVLYYDELFAQSYRDYTNLYEIHYVKTAGKYGQLSKTSYIVFIDKLDKYKLFTDSN